MESFNSSEAVAERLIELGLTIKDSFLFSHQRCKEYKLQFYQQRDGVSNIDTMEAILSDSTVVQQNRRCVIHNSQLWVLIEANY